MKIGLKEELFEYAYPKKRIKAAKEQYKTSKAQDIFGYIGSSLVLVLLSLPIALGKTWLWCIIAAVYVSALIACKISKDKHANNMLLYGATIAYFCVILSYFISTEALERFQASTILPLLIISIFCILGYEIFFAINIIFRRYSAKNNNIKKYPARYSTIGISIGTLIGTLTAKKISPIIETSLWSVWLIWIGIALLWVLSLSFLQKYVLYIMLRNKQKST